MTPLDDHSQDRRPIFYPVVIATVLLTIIGMIGGYLLSERKGPAAAPTTSVTSTTGSPPSAPVLLAVDGFCPDQTQKVAERQGAQGRLGEVMQVTTTRKTAIWICQDDLGQLYYHANKGGTDAPWQEGITALFIRDVRHLPDGSFEGVATDGNTFNLNRERLLITKVDHSTETQKLLSR